MKLGSAEPAKLQVGTWDGSRNLCHLSGEAANVVAFSRCTPPAAPDLSSTLNDSRSSKSSCTPSLQRKRSIKLVNNESWLQTGMASDRDLRWKLIPQRYDFVCSKPGWNNPFTNMNEKYFVFVLFMNVIPQWSRIDIITIISPLWGTPCSKSWYP